MTRSLLGLNEFQVWTLSWIVLQAKYSYIHIHMSFIIIIIIYIMQ